MSDLQQLQVMLISVVLGLLLRTFLRTNGGITTPIALVLFTAMATFVACIQTGGT